MTAPLMMQSRFVANVKCPFYDDETTALVEARVLKLGFMNFVVKLLIAECVLLDHAVGPPLHVLYPH